MPMTSLADVEYNVSGHTATITMNRPKVLNALSISMFRELNLALKTSASDKSVNFITITGAGKAFSAGLDIVQVAGFKRVTEARKFVYSLVKPFWDTFLSLDKIMIAVVNGPAYGAGAEIALFSDLVIASESATFTFSGGRVGALCCISGMLGSLVMNGRKVAEMNLTGEPISAEEAQRLGMINRVVPADRIDLAINDLIHQLMTVSPNSNSSFKRIQKSVIPKKAYQTAYKELFKTLTSPDFRKGTEAFISKTPPNYYSSPLGPSRVDQE
jgi:enoyl-CoA hydratase/carnithine racemase